MHTSPAPARADHLSEEGAASRQLAAWVCNVPRAWTAQGTDQALLAVRDTLMCAISGAGDLRAVLDALDAVPCGCPVPGRLDLRVLPDAAALAWGAAIHKRELDDQTYSMGGHLMCTVLPALLCTQYHRAPCWADLFDAVVVACEVASALNRCLSRKHMEQGWVATTTYGLIAATCAIARLERFDERQTLAALSLASAKAFGNKNLFGTPAKAVNPGLAARDAVLLARLARSGVDGSPDPLEGAYGFGSMYRGTESPDWRQLLPPSDRTPAITTGMAFKKHPCCASSHRCVDALLQLRVEHRFTPEDVEQVTAYVGPLNHLTLRYPQPRTPGEAMFSMPYILACALRRGTVALSDFTPRAVEDCGIRALMPRIDMQLLPEACTPGFVESVPLAHTVEVRLRGSSAPLRSTVLHPRGAPANAFDEADWAAKFVQCTAQILPMDHAARVLDALREPQKLPLKALVDLVAGFDSPDDPHGLRFERL